MAGFSLVPSGHGYNYTGMLTRSIVFSFALIVFLATTGLTLAAIIVPNWISYESHSDHHSSIRYHYGLHRRCSNTGNPPRGSPVGMTSIHCDPFPRYMDCEGEDRWFCSMWRSVGFLMSFGVVLEGMTIAAFAVLLIGGKQKREQGWAFMALMAGLAAVVQAIAMAIVAYLFENDERFFEGWFLDKSWTMCTTSWIFQLFVAFIITLAALFLPSEGGYELIPDRPNDDA